MWLPKPLYDALPAIYVIVGVLFLGGAAYLGFVNGAALAYAGIGTVCVLNGLLVRQCRERSRRSETSRPPGEPISKR